MNDLRRRSPLPWAPSTSPKVPDSDAGRPRSRRHSAKGDKLRHVLAQSRERRADEKESDGDLKDKGSSQNKWPIILNVHRGPRPDKVVHLFRDEP